MLATKKDKFDWSYVKCTNCGENCSLAYDNNNEKYIAVCEQCLRFTPLDKIELVH